MSSPQHQKSIGKDLLIPILLWAGIILVFQNVKNLPFEFDADEKEVLRYFVKVMMMVALPLLLIQLFYKHKEDFGIYFHKFSDSFKLAIRAYAIGGPAGMSFLLIGYLGWGIQDWAGALVLSLTYLLVFYLVPKVTKNLPTRNDAKTGRNTIYFFLLFSLISVAVAYFSYKAFPIPAKVLYYIFIVGLGEELLFRGYIQSSFNRYFGKPFQIAGVSFGWGLILAALLFGLIHALVLYPPIWPWALFTFVMGLTLGYIREKDGSLLAPILLHAMLDMPLAFVG